MGDGAVRLDWAVDAISVGRRHRKDLGDLDALAASIDAHGLLQPITITPQGVLVCGARRLAALKLLGHRRTTVWVRSGLSDKLGGLIAERDENTARKEYTKVELAALYDELKKEIAADAARRREATQFTAQTRNPMSHGPGNLPEPLDGVHGDSRDQAARMVGAPYKTMEKVLAVQRLAADRSRPAALRAQAADALAAIDAGAAVDPLFKALSSAARIGDLARVAADQAEPEAARGEARRGVVMLTRLEQDGPLSDDELGKAAEAAWARVQRARKPRRPARPGPEPAAAAATPPGGPRFRSARSFVWTWTEMAGWADQYDPAEIAQALTETQHQMFQDGLAGWNRFAAELARRRGAETPAAASVPAAAA
ncbi:MAG: ParB N-terminal domain-containing protein [Bifidobacteriaceae bacterium]|jgi:ParB family chromosome partitioning protein|nr:ParB N-terminal domain-containing protein [Bifidobacteriaceae bacterium]